MEGFGLLMALVDAIPVLLFSGSAVIIAFKFKSVLFIAGCVLICAAGCCKVLWKLLLAVKKKDYKGMNKLFLPLMVSGFLLAVISLIINIKNINFAEIALSLLSMPSAVFFALFLIGMAAMIVFSRRFDKYSVSLNWAAQIVNLLTQLSLLLGLLLLGA